MPTIRYLTGVADHIGGAREGEMRAVSPETAQRAVADGVAVLVRDEPPATPEDTAAPETASRRRRRPPRGGERA